MANTSRAGKFAEKHHGRTNRHETKDGPLDIIGAKDTSYPDLCYVRKGLKGNGATPGNPFGREISTPRETNPSINARAKRK